MRTIKIICFAISILISTAYYAQGRHGGGGHRAGGYGYRGGHGYGHGGGFAIRRSPYRPRRIFVYHPVWYPNYSCSRRWIFFPKYNIYWDNWRNNYMYWNGAIWLSQSAPPPAIINVNLASEKKYELKEKDDDNDNIGLANTEHKAEYKPE